MADMNTLALSKNFTNNNYYIETVCKERLKLIQCATFIKCKVATQRSSSVDRQRHSKTRLCHGMNTRPAILA